MAKITVDFFRVRMVDTPRTFEELIDYVANLGELDRNLQTIDGILRLQKVHKHHDERDADITKIRMSDLPLRAKADGSLRSIGLADDEGLGEQAAFKYHIPTQTLALQRNRHSVSPGGLANYLTIIGNLHSMIALDPVIEANALERLAAFQDIRKFRVKLARVDNAKIFADQGRGVVAVADLLELFKSPYADVQLSMGHNRESLPVQLVKAAARQWNSRGADHETERVTQIEITGKNAEDIPDVLDLIKCRMIEKTSTESKGRHSRYPERRIAVNVAFEKRHEELQRLHRTQR